VYDELLGKATVTELPVDVDLSTVVVLSEVNIEAGVEDRIRHDK
jgi:hypothetical protein